MVDGLALPTYNDTLLWQYGWELNSPGRRIFDIAQLCNGMSGRTIRRFSGRALTSIYRYGQQCSLNEAITALEDAAKNKIHGGSKAYRTNAPP